MIYRVWLQDKPKAELECLVRVGTGFWFSLSVRRCPVQVVRWEAGKEPLPPAPFGRDVGQGTRLNTR